MSTIANTKRTNSHIQSREVKHYALASTRQNRAKIVHRGRIQNIVETLNEPEDLAAAHTRFITKIAKAKDMMLQVGRRDNRPPDQAKQNEETPD